MNETRKQTTKWLRLLLVLELASFVLSLLGLLPIDLGVVRQWISRFLTAGIIYALFQLGAGRYRTSARLKTVWLAVTVGISLSPLYSYLIISGAQEMAKLYSHIIGILSTVMMVVSWVATWQLYNAHGDLVKDLSATLEKRWRQLFWVSLLVAIPVTGISYVLAGLVEKGSLGMELYGVLNILLISLPQWVVEALMIFYLYRTTQVLEKE